MSSKSENSLLKIRAIQGRIEKEDKQFSSHVLNPLPEDDSEEEWPSDDFTKPRNVT